MDHKYNSTDRDDANLHVPRYIYLTNKVLYHFVVFEQPCYTGQGKKPVKSEKFEEFYELYGHNVALICRCRAETDHND